MSARASAGYHYPPGHSAASGLAVPESRAFALRCVVVLLYLCLSLLFKCLSVWERIKARSHERLCDLLAISPCQVYEPEESAVVIIGGDEGVGRHIALNFSERGCTVFVLCPEALPLPQDQARQDRSNASSLIQEWHQRIKRSGRSPWGLVAPIVLDMSSGAQRTHAYETVDAYCAAHHLQLAAVIVLPTSVRITPRSLVRGRTDVSAWADIVRRCLVEPVSVVQDYSNMLAAASGRVVLLAASDDPAWTPSAYVRTLESAARFLRQELGSAGIRVSTVSTGPFAPASKLTAHMGADETATLASGEGGDHDPSSIRGVVGEVLRHFFVRYEDVWTAFYDIVRSRYPRERYVVGLHAAIQDALQVMPAALRLSLC